MESKRAALAEAVFGAVAGAIPTGSRRRLLQAIAGRADLAAAAGYHVYPRTYFSPLLLMEEVDTTMLERRRLLPGIDLNEKAALSLLQAAGQYVTELNSVPRESRQGSDPFWFANDWFNDFDAAALYALLRHLKPKRYVEVGCGFSSLISSRALARNATDGHPCEVLYSDPHPRVDIRRALCCGTLLEHRFQDLPLDLFSRLDAGDVVFVDTSHVVKLQSDVVHALATVLPALRHGVWIHFHDVFTPYDYPVKWATSPLFSNNEQYALEALLSGGTRYEVKLPLFLLWREHLSALETFFPRGRLQPQGFWICKS